MRVAHVVKGLGPGGAERLIVNQVRASDDPDVEYRVVHLLEHKSHLASDLRAAGADVECVGWGFGWPWRLYRVLSSGVDVVHVHSPIVAGAVRAMRGLHLLRVPLVTTEHNRWPRHHRLTRLINRLTLPLDNHTVAVSDDVRWSFPSRRQRSVEVIRHGVLLQEVTEAGASREAVRQTLGFGPEHFVIGIVANFRPEKGHDIFARAAQLLVEEHDLRVDVRFLIVGQGPGREDVERDVTARGLSPRVTFTGYRSDAVEVMSSFDVFTLTSRHEGLPVSLMEAMALGLPIVATRAGGIPEVVRDQHEGLLVDIDDTGGVADAWAALASDDERRRQMGQAARKASSVFDASSSTSEIESLYRRLIADGDRSGPKPAASS